MHLKKMKKWQYGDDDKDVDGGDDDEDQDAHTLSTGIKSISCGILRR